MTIAIDFDGVIHRYSNGYKDGSIYDSPVPGAKEFILECMYDKGWAVVIFSTRDPCQIKNWIETVLFPDPHKDFRISVLSVGLKFWNAKKNIGITNRKIAAHFYIDDRGLRFEGSFEGLTEQLEVLKTWQGK
jgi:hypothetical protein